MNLIPIAFLPSLGGGEIALIFLVLLLLFGAKKLPELARGIGKSAGEFKKAREEFEEEIRKGGEEATDEVTVSKASGSQSRDDA